LGPFGEEGIVTSDFRPDSPITHIVGARPNFMKAAPVIDALSRLGAAQHLVHTGQHYDKAMSDVFFDELGMPEPDVNLGVGSGSHGEQTGRLMIALEQEFLTSSPRAVVVYGDVNSTVAAALVATKLGIPVVHVEAGLRSFDRTMPEEVNRILTDAISDVLYVTSADAMAHLANEGIDPARMRFVGNTMIDTLVRLQPLFNVDAIAAQLELSGPYAAATLHRPANVDSDEDAARLVEGLHGVADTVQLVLPLHPRGRDRLERVGLGNHESLRIIEPLPYIAFMSLLSGASLVLTDSGGIQEETTVLGVPCLTLRANTERPVTITNGTNRLVGTDPGAVVGAAKQALSESFKPMIPPLWDGAAGKRIAADLLDTLAK
jgi:UDP-N-acetylglucosamine 2-epimerase (non-hydrolysing)